ncbi:unnamed protein product [Rodentolepis nana]|uniref:Reverse transcriptase domain-containing protein n=1 Tax=Rodentolepis nana TaxID=102285 RepID=A0A0R3TCC1_RODNA|nr:unnamed protein product [Rodentolepis nana]
MEPEQLLIYSWLQTTSASELASKRHQHLEELKRKRDALRNTADQAGRTKDVRAWRRQSVVLRQAILQAKRTSFDKFISNINYENDCQRTFKFLGNLQNNRERPKKKPIRLNSKFLNTDSKIANCFARFYSHKQKKHPFVRKSSRDLKIQVGHLGEIREDITTPNNVLTEPFRSCKLNAAIKQLKCKKSPGEDGIHAEFPIRMGPTVKETMLTLFNKIWETSLVPNQWKVAIVIPVLRP